jgi:hypothetical protein
MVTPRRGPEQPLSPLDDEAELAALREKGSHLSLPLRLLALLGALAFVILGLASALMPLRFQPSPAPQPSPTAKA